MKEMGELHDAVSFIGRQTSIRPTIACILGSGLGDFADEIESGVVIPSASIPHYPVSSVQGHEGKLVFGSIRKDQRTSRPLLVFKGRVHFYESGDLETTLLPVRLAHQLGAQTLIVTNAAGGINRRFKAGDLMLIRDILNLTSLPKKDHTRTSHGRGERTNRLFDPVLQDSLLSTATQIGLHLQEGVYCWLKGPSYETAAEIEMLRRMGADAVGMSTVPEIIEANRLGMRVVGISLISNLATGISAAKLSHAEVTDTANRVKASFTNLMREFILHQ